MKSRTFTLFVGIASITIVNQVFAQIDFSQLTAPVRDSIKFYIEGRKSTESFLRFCEAATENDSYSNYDRLVVCTYEFDTRKKLSQKFEFSRLFISIQQKGDSLQKLAEIDSEDDYDKKSIASRKYFGNPHHLSKHLARMKRVLEIYEKLDTGVSPRIIPLSDSQLLFYQAYTDCELALGKTDLSLLEEDHTREALVNGVINFFDRFKSTTDEKARIATYEALLEATYLLIEMALKPISELSFREKRSLYRTNLERIVQRVDSPPTKLLFDRFKLLNECMAFDQNNSLVCFCLFLAKSEKEAGNLTGAAHYLTQAINFKRNIPDNSPDYAQILSKLYAEKADVYELADYYQYYNLAHATELRRLSLELFNSTETKLAYAQTLTSYAEIFNKNYKTLTAREKIKIAISTFPEYAKAHYVASKIYRDLFYFYEAINSSNIAVQYAVDQRLGQETDEYKKLYEGLYEFYKRKGLRPNPSTREVFQSRVDFALEYNERLIKNIENKERALIKKDEYRMFVEQTNQSEINIKSIAEELAKESFREKKKLEEEVEILKTQIQKLKDLLARVLAATSK